MMLPIVRNLFAYGTLMCEDILREVSGCRRAGEKATLVGYARRSVKGEHYPALLTDERGRVEGVVYRNLPPGAWRRLDRFEGRMYARRTVDVELAGGLGLRAETYVVSLAFADRLDAGDWNFDDFLRRGKTLFQRHYRGYRSI